MDAMKYRTKRGVGLGILVFAFGCFTGFFMGRQKTSNNKIILHPSISANMITQTHPVQNMLENIRTEIERNFTVTVRSCLGPECYDSRPKGSIGDRIGILSLPGSGVQSVLVVVKKAMRKTAPKQEIILDTHVPAYGYGKNHGWNRIVRMARDIIPHAFSLLRGQHYGNISAISTQAFQKQVRQLARWHCRLSHVAAHTKMLTIFLEDVLDRPVVEIEKIMTFIGLPMLRPELIQAVAELNMEAFIRDRAPTAVPPALRDAGLAALEDEMVSTNGLTNWPCKTFTELDTDGERLQLAARELAANCSDPWVHCSVGFDQKEHRLSQELNQD